MYSIRDWLNYTLLGVLYTMGFHSLWYASTHFETIPNTISWYLPAGFRLVFFLLTPYRSWPIVYLISSAVYIFVFGPGGVMANEAFATGSLSWYLSNLVGMPVIVMGSAWLYRRYFSPPFLDRVQSTVALLGLSLAVSACLGTVLLGRRAFYEPDLVMTFPTKLFEFAIGDLIGIAAILPLILVLWSWWKEREAFEGAGAVLLGWGVFMIALIILHDEQFSLSYYAKVFSILPAIFFSYRYGWKGAAVSVFFICVMTYVSALVDKSDMMQNQVFVLSMSLCCLFLGASISEHEKLNKTITEANQELSDSNAKLSKLVADNRRISGRLIKAQEQERLRLSRELHDDFGQRITEIKLKATLARCDKIKADDLLTDITRRADDLYFAIKASIGALRPESLEQSGLVETLRHGELASLVQLNGLKFAVEHNGEDPRLSDEQAINLYRICQESVNNSLKHSRASAIKILIESTPEHTSLTVSDNGYGFDTRANNKGFGLISMRERAQALAASFEVRSDRNGTSIIVRVPLPDAPDKSLAS